MPKRSAGLLMHRKRGGAIEVFLVHPGGPFYRDKDAGSWSIPKGEYDPTEDPLDVARREFKEETGGEARGDFHPLKPLKQPSGKIVSAWHFEGDCDPATLHSNSFTMEWPPGSGKTAEFPEVDRGGWFSLGEAREKILRGQAGFLDELEERLDAARSDRKIPPARR